METGDRLQVHAQPSHLEDHPAAEAVTDRRDPLRIRFRTRLQDLERRLEATPGLVQIGHGLSGEFARVIRMRRGLAIAKHIDRHGDISESGQHLGPVSCVVVVSPPLVDHEHTWTRPGDGVVPGHQTFHDDSTSLVSDVFRLHCGVCLKSHGSGN